MNKPLDYEIENARGYKYHLVWHPDRFSGECIGEGKDRKSAIQNAIDNLNATIEALKKEHK